MDDIAPISSSMIQSHLIINTFFPVELSLGFIPPSSRYSAQQLQNIPLSLTTLNAARKIDVGQGEAPTNFGKELLNHELLTANDEFQLSRQYKLGNQVKAQRKLMATKLEREVTDEELAKALGLASEEHVNILINRGRESKKLLIKANMRLVFHISKYYRYRGVAYPDLIQEGNYNNYSKIE